MNIRGMVIKWRCSKCGKTVFINQQGCLQIELKRCIQCGNSTMVRTPLNAVEKLIPGHVLEKLFN